MISELRGPRAAVEEWTHALAQRVQERTRELEQVHDQLIHAGKMAALGELAAGVAHEINNPLAIILTERQILLDMLEQTKDLDEGFKKELMESLNQMDVQINRCKRITHNLLRFSRRTRSVIEKVDLNSFLEEVVELMEREARSSGIKFQTELDENLKPVLSDPSQLQQVFLNLITNAIDAHDGKPYGTIRISTRADDEHQKVRIVFADTGSGIPKEVLNKIFDPFFTTKASTKGTGLGLAVSYGIIKKHGGNIEVTSTDEMGRLLAVGLTGLIVIQAIVNMGGVTGLLPITGVPLPFVSAGGSSLVVCMASIGILVNISRQCRA